MTFLLFILITSLTCLALCYMPSLILILAVVWGIQLILGGLFLSKRQLTLVFIINCLILLLVAGYMTFFVYILLFAIGPIIMAWLASVGRDYYSLQKWGIIGAFLGVTLLLAFIYGHNGDIGITQMETKLNNAFEESLKIYDQTGLLKYQGQELTRDQLAQDFRTVAHTMAAHLPALYYVQAIITTFLALFTASYIGLKYHVGRLKRRPFEKESMPWQLVWVVILGLALWLWGKDNNNLIYYTGSNILAVLVPISVYYGLAALLFRVKRLRIVGRKWLIIIFVVLSTIFLPSAIVVLSIVGLFDSLLDFRKIRLGKEE